MRYPAERNKKNHEGFANILNIGWEQERRILPELDEADADGGQGRDGEEDEEEHSDLHVHPPLLRHSSYIAKSLSAPISAFRASPKDRVTSSPKESPAPNPFRGLLSC